jgi:hypothetical protein
MTPHPPAANLWFECTPIECFQGVNFLFFPLPLRGRGQGEGALGPGDGLAKRRAWHGQGTQFSNCRLASPPPHPALSPAKAGAREKFRAGL